MLSAALGLGSFMLAVTPAQAVHWYGGLLESNGTPGLQAGDALSFVVNTGPNIGQVVNSDILQFMDLSLEPAQAGLFAAPDGLNGGITFTALSNGRNWTGTAYRAANPYAATSGALLQLRIVSITGPLGANFSLWDTAVNPTGPTDTYTIGTGITLGDGLQNLTNLSLIVGDGLNDGIGEPPTAINNPPVDPYGHIHNRSTVTDTVGDYTVTYLLHDANGIHPDSAPFVVNYTVVVPEPSTIALLGGVGLALGALRRRR